MLPFIIRRVFISLVLVVLVVTMVFFLIRLIPGDPAQVVVGENASQEQVQLVRQRMGLEDALSDQYIRWISKFARLDLGVSLIDGRPIVNDIAKRLPRTLELAIIAALGALLVGLPAGVYAASHRNRLGDAIASAGALLGLSVPNFVTGTLAILVFGVLWKILPSGGYTDFAQDPGKHIASLVMPASVLIIGLSASIIRMTRASMLDVLGRDFVRTAHAKGLPNRVVLSRHVVRNGLLPVIAAFGIQLGNLIGGTVITEAVFNWPGISSLLIGSIGLRDYTAVQAVIAVIALIFLMVNLVTEILYGYLDPRIRYS
ncbi:MAG: ABC transporter permease [Chloroflexi bacterium]|nr:ABC transporter permease [Chloroflexota bacterium]